MRIWTVHASDATAAVPRGPLLLPERFAWGAALFGPLWLLAHGVWLAAVLAGALVVGALLLPPGLDIVGVIALALLLGWSGHDLRRARSAARGWRLVGVVAAESEDAALLRVADARPDLLRPTPAIAPA